MGPGSHITTISNATHHYIVYTTTLLSPTHNLISPILPHSSFFHLDWQCVPHYFRHYIVREPNSCCCIVYTKRPSSGKRETAVNDGGDDSTYSHVFTIRYSTLLCAFNDRTVKDMRKPKRYKAAKISFAPHTQNCHRINENGFRFCGNVFSYMPFQSVYHML